MEVKFQVNEGTNFGNLISVHLTEGCSIYKGLTVFCLLDNRISSPTSVCLFFFSMKTPNHQ